MARRGRVAGFLEGVEGSRLGARTRLEFEPCALTPVLYPLSDPQSTSYSNMDIPSTKPAASQQPGSPSTSPSASHLAQRLESLAVSARPDASPLRKEQDRQDAQRRVENLERLGDSSTGAWEKGRTGVVLGAQATAGTGRLSFSLGLPSQPTLSSGWLPVDKD